MGNLWTDGTFPANFQRLKIPCVLNQLCRVSHRGTLWVGLFPAKAGRPTPHPKSHPKSIPRNFRPLTFFSNSCIVLTVIAAQLFYEHSTQFPDLSKGSRLILPPSQAENKYHVLGFEGTRVNIPSVPRFLIRGDSEFTPIPFPEDRKQTRQQAQPILKTIPKFPPKVCSLIRGNAHNKFMVPKTPEIRRLSDSSTDPGGTRSVPLFNPSPPPPTTNSAFSGCDTVKAHLNKSI